jgi:hypothetical protein
LYSFWISAGAHGLRRASPSWTAARSVQGCQSKKDAGTGLAKKSYGSFFNSEDSEALREIIGCLDHGGEEMGMRIEKQ